MRDDAPGRLPVLDDAHRVPPGSVLDADVCIIGAGAAGITLARQWVGRPWRVCLIESGGRRLHTPTQRLACGESVGLPYFALDDSRLRHFGGTTSIWTGWCRPFDELDFQAREGIAHTGWPINRAQLDPYYSRAHELCQLGPYDYDLTTWQRGDSPAIPLDPQRIVTKLFQFSPPTDFGAAYGDELAAAENVHVLTWANVIELQVDDGGQRLTHARVATLGGNSFRVAAKHFVLAGGAIENARLLLLSNAVHKAGLGNQHDLVGRFFLEHPYINSATWRPADPQVSLKLYSAHTVEQKHGPARIAASLSLSPQLLQRERLVSTVFIIPLPYKAYPAFSSPGMYSLIYLAKTLQQGVWPDRLRHHMARVMRNADKIAITAWRKRFTSLKPPVRRVVLRAFVEAAPNPHSRVQLSAARDALGQPTARLDWRLSPIDRRSLDCAHGVLSNELMRCGLGELEVHVQPGRDDWPDTLSAGRHHMGTTRMHADPKQGVVDADCKVHGLANLFVAGSSVFTTAGSANPTLTIIALALRLADHVESLLPRPH